MNVNKPYKHLHNESNYVKISSYFHVTLWLTDAYWTAISRYVIVVIGADVIKLEPYFNERWTRKFKQYPSPDEQIVLFVFWIIVITIRLWQYTVNTCFNRHRLVTIMYHYYIRFQLLITNRKCLNIMKCNYLCFNFI